MHLNIQTAERRIFQLTLQQESYNNCHQFTSNFIVSLYEYFDEQMGKDFSREIFQDTYEKTWGFGPESTEALRKLYKGFIERGMVISFDKDQIASAIRTCSLILFVPQGGVEVSHSMIALSKDDWIGANNVNSLGEKEAMDLSGGVKEYNNMENRMFTVDGNMPRGGWDASNHKMRYLGLGTPIMDTYALPLLVPDYLTFQMVPEVHGGCCCEIV